MRVFFDGLVMVENGDFVEVMRGIPSGVDSIRATRIRNITKGWEKRSRIDTTLMTEMPKEINPPVRGKVRNLAYPGNDTEFDLIPGDFVDDHIFIAAGNRAKGRETLLKILNNELMEYVKICDPYINDETFLLLRDTPDNIPIFILYEKPGGSATEITIEECLKKMSELGKRIRVKKRKEVFHSRYILTRGTGWVVGHSLKDVGDKDTTIEKMKNSEDVEAEFDRHWAAD